MKRLLFLLAMPLAFSAAVARPAYGQIVFPLYDPNQPEKVEGVSFEPAKDGTDFRHGTMLKLTKKDGTVVQGILVRRSPKDNAIFVRTEPGLPPVRIPGNDLKQVDKGMIRPIAGEVESGDWKNLGGGLQENSHGVFRLSPKRKGGIPLPPWAKTSPCRR